jgi:hypothetical protein
MADRADTELEIEVELEDDDDEESPSPYVSTTYVAANKCVRCDSLLRWRSNRTCVQCGRRRDRIRYQAARLRGP